jgi:hypothetical protein
MSDGAYVIRFPDGDFEYVVSPTPAPSVGAKLKRRNAVWKVTEVVESEPVTVHVALAPAPERASNV